MHLHVVLTERDEDGCHLVVPVGSTKPGMNYDETCVLQVSEHSFIKTRSVIYYGFTTLARAMHIVQMIERKVYVAQREVTPDLCDRIREGVLDSDFTPRGMQNYYKAVMDRL